jgi:hypothetical protein
VVLKKKKEKKTLTLFSGLMISSTSPSWLWVSGSMSVVSGADLAVVVVSEPPSMVKVFGAAEVVVVRQAVLMVLRKARVAIIQSAILGKRVLVAVWQLVPVLLVVGLTLAAAAAAAVVVVVVVVVALETVMSMRMACHLRLYQNLCSALVESGEVMMSCSVLEQARATTSGPLARLMAGSEPGVEVQVHVEVEPGLELG